MTRIMASKMLTWIRILTTNQTKQKQPTQNQTNPNHQKMDEMDHQQKKLSHLQVRITKQGLGLIAEKYRMNRKRWNFKWNLDMNSYEFRSL